MKINNLLFLILVTAGLLGACQKDKTNFEEGLWQVTLLEDEQGTVTQFDAPLYLELVNRKQYILRLDVNTCGGEYEKGKGIVFSPPYCTEACCDSAEAIRLMESLGRVRNYSEKPGLILLKGEKDLITLVKAP
jgi:hypothetical protein